MEWIARSSQICRIAHIHRPDLSFETATKSGPPLYFDLLGNCTRCDRFHTNRLCEFPGLEISIMGDVNVNHAGDRKLRGCYLDRFPSCSPTSTHGVFANLRWNICKNRIGNRTYLDLVMVVISFHTNRLCEFPGLGIFIVGDVNVNHARGKKVCGCYSDHFSSCSPTSTHGVFANLLWNICKNRIENRTYPDLVMVVISVCLSMSELDRRSSRFRSLFECEVVHNVQRRSPVSF